MRCTTVLCYTVLLMHLKMTSSQTKAEKDCSELDSCDRCTGEDSELNLTRCVWRSCENDNNTRCIADTDEAGDCAVFNERESCPDTDNTDTGNTEASEMDDVPETEVNEGGFSMPSFMGGMILVLVLQAGGFFAMRFLKTKDSSYDTIEQT